MGDDGGFHNHLCVQNYIFASHHEIVEERVIRVTGDVWRKDQCFNGPGILDGSCVHEPLREVSCSLSWGNESDSVNGC